MTKYFVTFIIAAFIISCDKSGFETYHFFGLGTIIDVTIPKQESDKLPLINNFIKKISDNITNDEKSINNAPINQLVSVSDDFIKIYERALFYYNIDNAYNPAAYTVQHLYGFPEGPFIVPEKKLLEQSIQNAGFYNLVLQNNKFYKKTDLKVDFSANAKGYIIDKTSEYIKSLNIHNFIINIGGDLYVSGKKDNKFFNIGIKTPDNNVLNVVKISNKSVATSGNYERYFIDNGTKYNHIFSGINYVPEEKYQSVSVIAKTAENADGFATLFYLLDIDKIEKYCKLYDLAVLILTMDNKTVKLCGWNKYE